MKKVDVLIVGGGPAGSSVAMPLVSEGFSVVILEKKEIVGVPNHCGEGISTLCLEEAGFSEDQPWIVREVKGARIIFPNRTTVNFTQRGFSIDRPGFDQALSRRAVEHGAEVLVGTGATQFDRQEHGWRVKTSCGETYEASYLVGAGGAKCPVARYFGQRPFLLPAFQYKFKEPKLSEKMDPAWLDFYHDASFPGGYAWVFPRKDEIAIGAGSNCELKETLNALCRRLGYDPEQAEKVEGGPIPFLKEPMEIVFPRALCVGDSGGFTYPLTKGGIHGAIWSGRLAGNVLVDALKSGDPGRINAFNKLVKAHPARRPRHLRMPQTFFTFTNGMFNGIGRIMDGREFHDLPVLKMMKELTRPNRDLIKGIVIGGIIQFQFRKTRRFSW